MTVEVKDVDPLLAPDRRCSSWARAQHLEPIGTAGSYTGYLLVEWPLPWPRDVALVPELEEVARQAMTKGLRLQALVPTSSDEQRRVIAYRLPRGDRVRGGLVRRERCVAPELVLDAAIDLVAEEASDDRDEADANADLLVCTHGRRDRCCGSLGTELALSLASLSFEALGGRSLWRTSHTGGHRFAPTAILLPEATVWAYLDEPTLRTIVSRKGDVAAVLGNYRGYSLLSSPRRPGARTRSAARGGLGAVRSRPMGRGRWRRGAAVRGWDERLGGAATRAASLCAASSPYPNAAHRSTRRRRPNPSSRSWLFARSPEYGSRT